MFLKFKYRLAQPFIMLLLLVPGIVFSEQAAEKEPVTFSLDSLSRLPRNGPILVWRKGDEALVREAVKEDDTSRIFHQYLLRQADGMVGLDPLQHVVTGRRLLGVSRQFLKRACHLAYAWRMTGEQSYLEELDRQLQAVCTFSDWNPSHFLDTAEMSLGVALALDWAGPGLPEETVRMARKALLEKGLRESFQPSSVHIFELPNNWNQVCQAGMVAAALVLAGEDPALAVATLDRMAVGLPRALATYDPDGVYPEGASYWDYGTLFNVVLLSMLDTALDNTCGFERYPGFLESADAVHQLTAPSGMFFNFSDCDLSVPFLEAMPWFAMVTGQERHRSIEAIRQLPGRHIDPAGGEQRLAPLAMLWHVHFQPGRQERLPLDWYGRGENPVVVFRSAFGDPDALYLALKGGSASLSHPNMDAGSFILELDGVRWALDMPKGDYHQIEEYFKIHGGNLWDGSQESARWKLLNKNNFGHSTITVDERLHRVGGEADIVRFDPGSRSATVDISGPLGPPVTGAIRSFRVNSSAEVEIEDVLELKEPGTPLRWQMMTQADVEPLPGGALLRQDGKYLRLDILSPAGAEVELTELYPPPMEIEPAMPGLKRINIKVNSGPQPGPPVRIKVRLTGITEDPDAS